MVCPNHYQLEFSLSCLVTQLCAVFHTGCRSLEQGLSSLTWQDVKQVQTKTWVAAVSWCCMLLVLVARCCTHRVWLLQLPAQVQHGQCSRSPEPEPRDAPCHPLAAGILLLIHVPTAGLNYWSSSKHKNQGVNVLGRDEHKSDPCQEWQKASDRSLHALQGKTPASTSSANGPSSLRAPAETPAPQRCSESRMSLSL